MHTARIVPVKNVFLQDSARSKKSNDQQAYNIIPRNTRFVSRRKGNTGSSETHLAVAYHCHSKNAHHKKPASISNGRISRAANDTPAVAC